VVDVAQAHGVDILAISDHDNLAAYFEIRSYAEERGVTLIPAIELSCEVDGIDVHILAYAFDATDERIEASLVRFRETRHSRGYAMVEKLRAIGVNISAERVDQLAAGGAMGRPHVARALVEAGYVSSVSEAFDKYLGTGKPGYLGKERFAIDEAVQLIRDRSVTAVIVDVAEYPDHTLLVPRLLDAGIDAAEVMHPQVDDGNRERYTNLARFRGKFTTGGSDDHGTVKTSETLGTVKVPETMIQPILSRL